MPSRGSACCAHRNFRKVRICADFRGLFTLAARSGKFPRDSRFALYSRVLFSLPAWSCAQKRTFA
jgi:hypothetical protein